MEYVDFYTGGDSLQESARAVRKAKRPHDLQSAGWTHKTSSGAIQSKSRGSRTRSPDVWGKKRPTTQPSRRAQLSCLRLFIPLKGPQETGWHRPPSERADLPTQLGEAGGPHGGQTTRRRAHEAERSGRSMGEGVTSRNQQRGGR